MQMKSLVMGNTKFCGYLISRFWAIREFRENYMHANN